MFVFCFSPLTPIQTGANEEEVVQGQIFNHFQPILVGIEIFFFNFYCYIFKIKALRIAGTNNTGNSQFS